MSKKQKLLRKRFESQKLQQNQQELEENEANVKVKYSIQYLSWRVSDSEDSEDEIHTEVTLPLSKLRLKKA